MYSDANLSLLLGYPRTQRLGERPGENPDLVLIEEGFTPPNEGEPVLFHFVLPPRFVPSRTRAPLSVPKDPSVTCDGNVLTATFATKGGGKLSFWISRLQEGEEFANYDLNNIFDAAATKSTKVAVELNLGIIKIAFSDR